MDWSDDDKEEIEQLLKVTYQTLKSIMSDFAYMNHCWADFSQSKAIRQKEYKDTQAQMKNKMNSLKNAMNKYLKWIEPEDEEEKSIKKRLTRTQGGLLE